MARRVIGDPSAQGPAHAPACFADGELHVERGIAPAQLTVAVTGSFDMNELSRRQDAGLGPGRDEPGARLPLGRYVEGLKGFIAEPDAEGSCGAGTVPVPQGETLDESQRV